jgi:hypothetical protein
VARTIHTEIDIESSKEAVWNVLSDFEAYPDWNPFIRSIRGEPRGGSKLEVRLQPPGQSAVTFRPTVLAAVPGRELRWQGRLLVPGIFDGEHRLLIRERGQTEATFVQEELFAGVLVPFTGKVLARTQRGFVLMNQALKERVERGRQRPVP